MSLINKGTNVALDLTSGRKIDPPRSYALLHDPRGNLWPSNEGLIGPMQRTGKPMESDAYPIGTIAIAAGGLGVVGALAGAALNGSAGAWKGALLGAGVAALFGVAGTFNGETSQYLGAGYDVKRGDANIESLPRAAGSWRYVGEVERIWYERTGERYTGPFQHPFSSPATLYRHGKWLRLVLPVGGEWNWRGFVD